MKAYWGVEVYLRAFLTSELAGMSGQFHALGRYIQTRTLVRFG
jgi:hypothetical protein